MNMTVSAHVPVQVMRDYFGLSTDGLKPGIWSYGSMSKGKNFVFTADVIDEFEDVVKLIAFSNCVDSAGFKFALENAADEVALMELEFTALADKLNNIYYEALVVELEDKTIADKWHTAFTTDLVKATTPNEAPQIDGAFSMEVNEQSNESEEITDEDPNGDIERT